MVIDWNHIMKLIDSNEIDRIFELCMQMQVGELQEIKSKLIKEMQFTNNKNHRNTIAILLGDLKCNEAIEPIINLINNPENKNCRGTLVYVLQELKCESSIKKIIHTLFDGNLEVKCNMYDLLSAKVQYMSKEDRLECLNILRKGKEKLADDLELLEDVEENIFIVEEHYLISKHMEV